MNGDRYFVDSNVFLYVFDKSDPTKSNLAEAWLGGLWENASGALSWQVIQEFYWNALRKYKATPERARRYVGLMFQWRRVDVTVGLMERAWHWNDEAQVSFWDGLIIAAAERAQCRYLLSEDFQPGQSFESVTVVNPFKTSPPF